MTVDRESLNADAGGVREYKTLTLREREREFKVILDFVKLWISQEVIELES